MVLNGRKAASTFSWYKGKIGFPAYQEPSSKDYWKMLNGAKDDIIIYDQCGRLSSHLKMPNSHLGRYGYVQQELFKAAKNGVCGTCSQQVTMTTNTTTTPQPSTAAEVSTTTTATATITTATPTPVAATKKSKTKKMKKTNKTKKGKPSQG